MNKKDKITAEEQKEKILRRIRETPLCFPYADLKPLRRIESLENRYNAGMTILDADRLREIGLEEDHIPELLLCRWQAAKYITSRLQTIEITITQVAKECGVDRSYFPKFASGDRPLALEAPALLSLCIGILGESCHKVMFGEPGCIVLPGVFSLAAKYFERMPDGEQRSISASTGKLRRSFEKVNPLDLETGRRRDPDILTRERLRYLADSTTRSPEKFFGEKQPMVIRNGVKAYSENDHQLRPRFSFTFFLSFETGYALDYFISEDFASYVPCFYKDGDRCVEIRKNRHIHFVKNLFAVDEKTAMQMMEPVFAWAMKNGTK